MDLEPLIPLAEPPNQALARQVNGGIVVVDGNNVREHSVGELARDVDHVMAYLSRGGLEAGDRVGIRGPNSYEWLVLDLALVSLGCISVCLPSEAPEFDAVPMASLIETLYLAVLFQAADGRTELSQPRVVDLSKILGTHPPELGIGDKTGCQTVSPTRDVFTVAFSSGSTGRLKRLPISWTTNLKHMEAFSKAFDLDEKDRILVVLPFSAFQQRHLIHCAIWCGCKVVLARLENFLNALRHGRPTFMLGTPSFYEIVEQRFKLLPAWRRLTLLGLSRAGGILPDGPRRSWRARLFDAFHRLYGGDMRIMLVGSAPVKRSTLDLFRLAGFSLFEIYGMTEAGWIAWNRPGANKIGTAGTAAFPEAIRIASDGEVLVSCRWNQCTSYEVFEGETVDSSIFVGADTLATGDVGALDGDGYLTISGRKKNVIVTAGGVKVSPEEIEEKIAALPTVRHAIVFDHPNMPSLAAAIWTVGDNRDDQMLAVQALTGLNATVLRKTPVLGIVFPTMALSLESGLLTRNLKVDRSAVRRKFCDDLRSLGAALNEP
ncbi:long-chain fatty acid--CoA ligase [Bradyrhizobium hipponense]|uniref:Long-chain fatty acid--CoA ligase n=1 Tax=Bradyrhizobium hipponense TaxID=2605638 RepID=A0A5S4YKY5_9BRAD|nr:AMP-binding protein [Bradyrhizobium hipponense]TYO64147.1 long-chain fatty acid--CoA ligase [Bradyrhizobium hipponense]